MEDVKPIIAKNITALRQANKMTQIELAEKLNYSDKAVSKWERGESVPDIGVLKAIADMFGVTVDYLLQEEHSQPKQEEAPAVKSKRAPVVITMLSILLLWMLATLVFVILNAVNPQTDMRWWPVMCAVPLTFVIWLVFNSIWFNKRRNYLIISLLMWSTLASIILTVLALGRFTWQLVLLGIPGQIIIYVWSRFQRKVKV